jgi:hypothetical protein
MKDTTDMQNTYCKRFAMKVLMLIMLLTLFDMTLAAGDISGKWQASVKGENGTLTRTFVFKQDGTTLTGQTASDRFGKSSVQDGKIEGDTLSFTYRVDMEFGSVKISITGKVQGDVILMTAALDGGTLEFTARRVP